MSFDRALSDVKVASDFGVVTALEQEFDDLLFAGSHRSGHSGAYHFHLKSRAGGRKWQSRQAPSAGVKQARWS